MGASVQNASAFSFSLIHGERRAQVLRPQTLFLITLRRNTMNKDQTQGRVDEVKGKVKEVAGKVTGNKTMEHKGKVQNLKGQAQAGYGDLKADLKKAS
jgi:uncharacterized protein YjbJ (UPF0337 family)